VILDSARGLDCLTIKVEMKDGVHVSSRSMATKLTTAVRSYMTVTPVVEVMAPGTLAMGEGTSFRILDYRKGSGRYAEAD
jgi:phenylacetate-coenzyme A ligase PaaK-like adenylate-forming protein